MTDMFMKSMYPKYKRAKSAFSCFVIKVKRAQLDQGVLSLVRLQCKAMIIVQVGM